MSFIPLLWGIFTLCFPPPGPAEYFTIWRKENHINIIDIKKHNLCILICLLGNIRGSRLQVLILYCGGDGETALYSLTPSSFQSIWNHRNGKGQKEFYKDKIKGYFECACVCECVPACKYLKKNSLKQKNRIPFLLLK